MKSVVRTWPRQPLWLYAIWVAAFGMLVLSIRGIPFLELGKVVANLQPVAWLILGGLNLAIIFLLAARWWLILRAQGQRINLFRLTGYRLAAFSIAYFTPGPQVGGEPLQVHLLRSRHGLPESNAIASVSLDRLFEIIANFSFLALGLYILLQSGLFGDLPSGQALVFTLVILLIPVFYLVSLAIGKKPLAGILNHIRQPKWQAIRQVVEEAESLVGSFCRQKPLPLLVILLLSLFTWIGMITEYSLLLNYLGLAVSPSQAIIALTAARIAFIVPTPGGLGAFEASQMLVAEALGFSPLSGLSVSLVIRARDLVVAAVGLWLSGIFLKQSTKLGQVTRPIEEAK